MVAPRPDPFSQARRVSIGAALALSILGCGRIGFQSLPISVGPDADAMDASYDSASRHDSAEPDTQTDADTATLDSEAGTFADSGRSFDSGASADGGPSVDSGRDAEVCAPVCTNAHGTTSCNDGVCAPVCAAGFDSCDTNTNNGCETSLATASDCGRCGNVCPNTGGVGVCENGACTIHCPWTGVYAGRLNIQVRWPETIYAGGTGEISVPMRITMNQSALNLDVRYEVCGLVIPVHTLSQMGITESYAATFPTVAIDNGTASFTTTTTGALTGLGPQADLTVPPVTIQFGVQLANPASDPWPLQVTGLTTVDSDGDGNPGVTLQYLSSPPYFYVPLDVTRMTRAQRAYLSSRLTFGVNSMITSCDGATFATAVNQLDTHIVGCQLESGAACSNAQRDIHDAARPRYQVISSTLSVARAPANSTCSAIRALLP